MTTITAVRTLGAMRTWLPPLLVCALIGVAGWWWFAGAEQGPAAWRRQLREGSVEQQRAALQAIAADGDIGFLPDVTRVWERVYPAEGFQRDKPRPGSLQPELHALFAAWGRPAAEQLVGWAHQAYGRFVPCLIAAGVALGGQHGAELGRGEIVGGVSIRTYRFTFDTTVLEIPTYMGSDWYGQLEHIRKWRAYLVTLPK